MNSKKTKKLNRIVAFLCAIVMFLSNTYLDTYAVLFPNGLIDFIASRFSRDILPLSPQANNTYVLGSISDFESLSYTDPSDYQYSVIQIAPQEIIDLSDSAFKGIGSEDYPFMGSIMYSGSVTDYIILNQALFNSLSQAATVQGTLLLSASNDMTDPILARRYVSGDKEDNVISVSIDVTSSGIEGETVVTYSSFGGIVGEMSENTELTLNITNVIAEGKANITGDGDRGFFCNTMRQGAKLTVASFTGRADYSIVSRDANAGAIVGSMEKNAELKVGPEITFTGKVNGAEDAGGLVGKADNSIICLADNYTLNAGSITAGKYAGGLIGQAVDVSVDTQNLISVVADVSGLAGSGGIIGSYSVSEPLDIDITNYNINNTTFTTGSYAGGIFGVLENNTEETIAITGSGAVNTSNKGASNYGGLIGEYTSDMLSAGLKLDGLTVTSANTLKGNSYGGVIAHISGDDFVAVQDLSVNVNQTAESGAYFGGVIALSDGASLLDIGNVTVISAKNNKATYSGGIIGGLTDGVLRLSGKTDISAINPSAVNDATSNFGYLVGLRGSALVYGTGTGSDYNIETGEGWTLVRNKTGMYVSDIASWGEVIRVDGDILHESKLVDTEDTQHLLNYDTENHIVYITGFSGDDISQIADTQQLAAVALTIQCAGASSEGALRLTKDIDTACNLALSADVDLSNTGITGLLRDDGSLAAFTGKLDGNYHKITLDIGDAYGAFSDGTECTQANKGSGQIYNHSYLGLLAEIGTSEISNLVIDGNIYYGLNTVNSIMAGGLAAVCVGTEAHISVVTSDIDLYFDDSVDAVKPTYSAGFIGSANSASKLYFDGCTYSGSIIDDAKADDYYLGGYVGCMDGTGELSISNSTIKDASIIASDISNISKVGGILAATGNSTDSISIKLDNVNIDNLTISDKANASTGGFFGYEWRNVDFEADGVVITNSALTSADAGFGGLVYESSGHWKLSGDGVSFGANNTITGKTLSSTPSALMVCRGDDYNKDDKALYIEIGPEAYSISDNMSLTFSAGSGAYFDEIVGISIGSDGNGVVSISTGENSPINQLNINTYQNQLIDNTLYSNPYTRYYYNLSNLDKADSQVNSGSEMLMWSVGQYCEQNIASFFVNESNNAVTISGVIDLTGLSYYPVDFSSDITINNATITFDYEKIDNQELSYSNRRLADAARQHYMMQTGLFYNITTPQNKNLSIKITGDQGLTLDGSIGLLEDGSGALVVGILQGFTTGINDYIASFSDTRIVLDGIYVCGAAEAVYAPLLINKVGSYSSILVHDITTSVKYDEGGTTKTAATSLLGDIGSSEAVKIVAEFDKISLNSYTSDVLDNKAIFKNALFAESFSYALTDTSSKGSYNFTSTELADGAATLGYEISNTDSGRNPGEQYWTSDGSLVMDAITDHIANDPVKNFRDGSYLRYIHIEENAGGEAWRHEIDINQQASSIQFGCGTYDDPYIITEGGQLKALADFLASGSISNWDIRINYGIATKALSDTNSLASHNNGADDELFVAGAGTWAGEKGHSLSNNQVRAYLRNAYYIIGDDITLSSSFTGLGGYDPSSNVFSGVIVGNKVEIDQEQSSVSYTDEIPTITINAPEINVSQYGGVVRFANGCVIKNINLKYNSQVNIESLSAPAGKEPIYQVFFGGAIGYALGGDNIIDNVNLLNTVGEPVVKVIGQLDYYSEYDVTDSKGYLANIGGYVGLVGGSITEGGGVVFKNMTDCGKLSTVDYEWIDGVRYSEANDILYDYSDASVEVKNWKTTKNIWGIKTSAASGSNYVAYTSKKITKSDTLNPVIIKVASEYLEEYDFRYYITNGATLVNNSLVLYYEDIKDTNPVTVDMPKWFDIFGMTNSSTLYLYVTASKKGDTTGQMQTTEVKNLLGKMVTIDGAQVNLNTYSGKFSLTSTLINAGSDNRGLYRAIALSDIAGSAQDLVSISVGEGCRVYLASSNTLTSSSTKIYSIMNALEGAPLSFKPSDCGIDDIKNKYIIVLSNRTYSISSYLSRFVKQLDNINLVVSVNGETKFKLKDKTDILNNLHYSSTDFTITSGVVTNINDLTETASNDKRYYQIIKITEDMSKITAKSSGVNNNASIRYYIIDDEKLQGGKVTLSYISSGRYLYTINNDVLKEHKGEYLVIMVGHSGNTIDNFAVSLSNYSIEIKYDYAETVYDSDVSGTQNVAEETTADNDFYYWNPYVGRVLDGFVCNVGEGKLDNSDKNYKIPTLIDTDKLSIDDTGNVDIKNSQQLWVLSAIVNSGAGALGNSQYDKTSNAYYYGKTRAGSYENVGKPVEDATVKQDEKNWGGEVPKNPKSKLAYLVYNYTLPTSKGYKAVQVTSGSYQSSLTISSDLDMTDYGNGFRGIGSSYQDNISADVKKRALPLLNIYGNGNKITIKRNLYEYSDDRECWWTQGLGIFPVFYFANNANDNSKVENLTVSGEARVWYKDQSCSETGYIGEAAAGGLAGMTANGSATRKLTFSNVKAVDLTVTDSKYSGGLFGVIGMSSRTYDNKLNIIGTKIGAVDFASCSAESVTIEGGYSAGGFVGTYRENGTITIKGTTNVTNSTIGWVNDACMEIFNEIGPSPDGGTTNREAAKTNGFSGGGGLFGYTNKNIDVNKDKGANVLTIDGLMVYGPQFAYNCDYGIGGITGYTNAGVLTLYNTVIKNSIVQVRKKDGYVGKHEDDPSYYTTPAAGMVNGYSKGTSNIYNLTIDNCQVINAGYNGMIFGQQNNAIMLDGIKISNSLSYSMNTGSFAGSSKVGGITGGTSGGIAVTIKNVDMNNVRVVSDGVTGLISGMAREKSNDKFGDFNVTNFAVNNCVVATSQNTVANYYIGNNGTDPGFLVKNRKADNAAGGAGIFYGVCRKNDDGSGLTDGCAINAFNVGINDSIVGYYCGAEKLDYDYVNNKLVGVLDETTIGAYISENNGIPYSKLEYSDDNHYTGGFLGILSGGEKIVDDSMHVVGLSVQGKYYPYEIDGNGDAALSASNTHNYIIYADYLGDFASEGKNTDGSIAADTTKIVAAGVPYVVVNSAPDKVMTGYESVGAATGRFFTGDGMVDKTHKSIISDLLNGQGERSYNTRYRLVKEEAEKFASGSLSEKLTTFSKAVEANLETAPIGGRISDFDVLLVDITKSAEITELINAYISLLTNWNMGYTSISAETYRWDNTGKFVKQEVPSIIINADNSMSVRPGAHDNQLNQLTVLDVFYVNPNNAAEGYHLHIPVVVKKILETEFSIKMLNGSSDYSDAYKKDSSLLASYGERFTAQLTYSYIWTASEWNDNIAAGVNLLWSYDKQVQLGSELGKLGEATTRYILVDMNRRGGGNTFFVGTGNQLNEITEDNKSAVLEFNNIDGFESVYIADLLPLKVNKREDGELKLIASEDGEVPEGASIRRWNPESEQFEYYGLKSIDTDPEGTEYFTITVGAGDTVVPVKEVYYLTINCKEGEGVLTQTASLGQVKMDSTDKKALPSKLKNANTKTYTLGDFFKLENVSINPEGESHEVLIRPEANDYIDVHVSADMRVESSEFDNYAKDNQTYMRFAIQLHKDGTTGSDSIEPATIDVREVKIGDSILASSDYSLELHNGVCYLTVIKTGATFKNKTITADVRISYEGEPGKIVNQFPLRTNSSDTSGVTFSVTASVAYSQESLDGSSMTGRGDNGNKFYREEIVVAGLTYNSYNTVSIDGNTSQLGINGQEIPSDETGQIITSLGMYDATTLTNLKDPSKLICSLALARKTDNPDGSVSYQEVDINKYLSQFRASSDGEDEITGVLVDGKYSFEVDLTDEQIASLGTDQIEINLAYYVFTDEVLEALDDGIYANYKVTLTAYLADTTGYKLVDEVSDYLIYTNAKFYTGIISVDDFD